MRAERGQRKGGESQRLFVDQPESHNTQQLICGSQGSCSRASNILTSTQTPFILGFYLQAAIWGFELGLESGLILCSQSSVTLSRILAVKMNHLGAARGGSHTSSHPLSSTKPRGDVRRSGLCEPAGRSTAPPSDRTLPPAWGGSTWDSGPCLLKLKTEEKVLGYVNLSGGIF